MLLREAIGASRWRRYTPMRSRASRQNKTGNSPSRCPWESKQGQQRGWPHHPAVPHPGGSTRVPCFSSFRAQNTLIVVVSHPTPTQGVVSGPGQGSPSAHGGQSVRNYTAPGSRSGPPSPLPLFRSPAERDARRGWFAARARSRGSGTASTSQSIPDSSRRDVVSVDAIPVQRTVMACLWIASIICGRRGPGGRQSTRS